jgi:hypothetical protein
MTKSPSKRLEKFFGLRFGLPTEGKGLIQENDLR